MAIAVLATGFEPFGEHDSNPSGDFARAMMRETAWHGIAAFAVLPVTYDGASELVLARARVERPRTCVMFGLGGCGRRLQIERCAHNVMDGPIDDNAGERRRGVAIARSSAPIVTSEWASRLFARLQRDGVPTELSDDAGRFVCNATYYRVLVAAIAPSVFVHVPRDLALGGEVGKRELECWMRATVNAAVALAAPISE